MATRSPLFWLGPVVYTLGFLLLAALLAPVLHWVWKPIDENPFRRYTDRALMIAALLCLLPYLVRHWKELGWSGNLSVGKALGLGVAIGVGVTLLLNALLLGLGYRALVPEALWSALPKALLAAVLVSLLEEILFRGAMLKALRDRLGALAGFWLTAFLYAWVHFLKAPESFQPDPVTWTSGFTSVGLALANLFSAETWSAGSFWTYLLVGVIFGIAYVRTGALWLPIGLHAGFILGIQWSSSATTLTPAGRAFPLGADGLTGGLTYVVLALLALGLWLWLKPKESTASAAGSAPSAR